MKKSNIRVCVLLGFYILYLVIGASIFSAIEGPEERGKVKALKKIRTNFLRNNKECLSGTHLHGQILMLYVGSY